MMMIVHEDKIIQRLQPTIRRVPRATRHGCTVIVDECHHIDNHTAYNL
jgi:hypothetical protein